MNVGLGGGDKPAPWPKFPETPRPTLELVTGQEMAPLTAETKTKLLRNDQKIKNHGARLEAQIKKYNELRDERFGE